MLKDWRPLWAIAGQAMVPSVSVFYLNVYQYSVLVSDNPPNIFSEPVVMVAPTTPPIRSSITKGRQSASSSGLRRYGTLLSGVVDGFQPTHCLGVTHAVLADTRPHVSHR